METYRLRDFLFYGVVRSSFRYIVAPITMQSFGEIVWQTYLFLRAYPSIVPHVLYYGVIKYSILVMINYQPTYASKYLKHLNYCWNWWNDWQKHFPGALIIQCHWYTTIWWRNEYKAIPANTHSFLFFSCCKLLRLIHVISFYYTLMEV